MNVLYITQYYWPENYPSNDCVQGLLDVGCNVTVLTGMPNYPTGRFADGYGWTGPFRQTVGKVEIVRTPVFPRGTGSSVALALNYVSFALFAIIFGLPRCRDRFDVIVVCQGSPVLITIPGIVARRLFGAPLVVWVLDLWPESLLLSGRALPRILRKIVTGVSTFIYSKCDRILVSSRGFEAPLRGRNKTAPIQYWPQWAPNPAPDSGAAIVPDLPIGFRICFTGNIGNAQNFEVILEVAEMLKGNDAIKWIIAGDGSRFEWLKEQVHARGLDKAMILLGRLPESAMPSLYAKSDALLVALAPSQVNAMTLPRKVVSYLAAGKPILACAEGETAETIKMASAGLTCAPEDASALAAAVETLQRMSQAELQLLGANAAKYSAEHFMRSKLLDQLMVVLEGASRGNNRSGSR